MIGSTNNSKFENTSETQIIFLSRDNCASLCPLQNGGLSNRKHDGLSVCHKSGREFGNNEVFCRGCGTLTRRKQENELCNSTEEITLKGDFIETIVQFLLEDHGISIFL